ncbi:MAG: hypothetical protein QGG40_17985, partial [Myxococcota bacterium]|nr:hypothetical protein [Myxococcota bacterium]
RAYSSLVLRGSSRDPRVARAIALELPDHLARVPPGQRARYVSFLEAVVDDRVEAAPLVLRTLPDLLTDMNDEQVAR